MLLNEHDLPIKWFNCMCLSAFWMALLCTGTNWPVIHTSCYGMAVDCHLIIFKVPSCATWQLINIGQGNLELNERRSYHTHKSILTGTVYTRVYPKVSGPAAWSENCKWYSSLPQYAVVSLFCESSGFYRHSPLYCFSTSVYCCCCCLFRYDSVRKLLDIPS